jgi:hypothetical protein
MSESIFVLDTPGAPFAKANPLGALRLLRSSVTFLFQFAL